MNIDNYMWNGKLNSLKAYNHFDWQHKKYLIQKQTEYDIERCRIRNLGILIYPEIDDNLSFLLHDNELDIYTAEEDYITASKVLSLNIEHFLTNTILDLNLLMTYINKIEYIFDNMKGQITELFKQTN